MSDYSHVLSSVYAPLHRSKLKQAHRFLKDYAKLPSEVKWGTTNFDPKLPVYPSGNGSVSPEPVVWYRPYLRRVDIAGTDLEEGVRVFTLSPYIGGSYYLVSYRLHVCAEEARWEPFRAEDALKILEPRFLLTELA